MFALFRFCVFEVGFLLFGCASVGYLAPRRVRLGFRTASWTFFWIGTEKKYVFVSIQMGRFFSFEKSGFGFVLPAGWYLRPQGIFQGWRDLQPT